MKQLINLKSFLVKSASVVLISGLVTVQAFAGWGVSGTKVIDPKGNNFIFRGINHAHAWYPDKTAAAMTDIAATGANSIRVVLSNGDQWTRNTGSEISTIISQCKAAKLVCVLEVHDSTGFGEQSAATNISKAAAYWVSSDVKSAIVGQEDYVIVNIANEPFGNGVSAATYTSDTSNAIKTLRNAGLTHLIMVDGSTWGQDNQYAMRDNAATIFAADSMSRTMFSVHMYEVYNSASVIQNYLTTFQAKGFALIVGEFGTENNGNRVDAASILQYTQQMGIGYIGWSWSGNGSCCVPLDIVNSWNPASLSTWGTLLINSANGIKATSKLATNYSGVAGSSTAASSKASVAASSTPRSSTPAVSSTPRSSTPAVSSSSVSGGQQCNWYGTLYPLCVNTTSGWGYENNKSCIARTTCAGQPSPYGIVGGTTSTAASSRPASSVAASITPASSKPATSTAASSRSSSATTGGGLSCTYVLTNSWQGGFQGTVRITNGGTSAVSSWTATWQYAGANRITGSWNGTLTGSNPYSATNLSWNGNLAAGQSAEVGVQGNTNGGAAEIPAVTCK